MDNINKKSKFSRQLRKKLNQSLTIINILNLDTFEKGINSHNPIHRIFSKVTQVANLILILTTFLKVRIVLFGQYYVLSNQLTKLKIKFL